VTVLVWVGRGPRPADRMRRAVAGLAAALALASALEMYLLATATDAPYSADASRLYYGTDTHAMGLLLGAALGALMAAPPRARGLDGTARSRLPVWLTDLVAVAGIAALAAVVLTGSESDPWLYRGGFLAFAAGAAALAGAVARPASRVGRVLSVRALRWLANRSYAIYLWHWPVAVVTRPGADLAWPAPAVLVLRLAVTLVLADVTYRGVERPLRQLGVRVSLRNGARRLVRIVAGQAPIGSRLVSAAVAALVLVAGTVLAVGPRPSLSAGQRALAATRGGRDLPIAGGRVVPASPVARIASGLPVAVPSSGAAVPPASRLPLSGISAYGDSVLLGARQTLARCFPGGRMDAVEGRQADPILADVLRDARTRRIEPIVVIHVGDNGLMGAAELRDTLTALRTARRVLIVNLHVDRPWEGPNNRTIARVAPGFPNVRVVDWHQVAGRHHGWLYDDQIHLTHHGAVGYAELLATAARAA